MKMDIFDLMYELNDVSDYLVMESERKSPQMRERLIVKWSTIAASVCLIMAAVFFAWRIGAGSGHAIPGQTVGELDATNTDAESETNDTEMNTVTESETEPVTDPDDLFALDPKNSVPQRQYDMLYGYMTYEEVVERIGKPNSLIDSVSGKYIVRYSFTVTGGGFNIWYPECEADAKIERIERWERTLGSDHETITYRGAVYDVYDSYAIVSGASGEEVTEVVIMDEVNGVPVVGITDGAFDGMRPLRIYCDAAYDMIYDTARAYAVEHEHIFIEMNSDKLPDHYYPDWVERLDWSPRDTTGDKYVAVDDNDEITSLVEKYLSTGEGYDELLKRVVYRFACAACHDLWNIEGYGVEKDAYVRNGNTDDRNTDYDRYTYFIYDYTIREIYQFAFGYVDTYEEWDDYARFLYTEDVAEAYIDWHGDWVFYSVDGYIFYSPGGGGHSGAEDNSIFSIEITGDTITLHERREVWEGYDKDGNPTYGFDGEYNEYEYTMEKHDGKWQITEAYYIDYYCMIDGYESLIGER